MKKLILTIIILLTLKVNAFAHQEDLYSWTWWSNKSGITTGTIRDIMEAYLSQLGYVGTTRDKLHKWLADQTGKPVTWDTSDLQYYYFVVLNNSGGASAITLENTGYFSLDAVVGRILTELANPVNGVPAGNSIALESGGTYLSETAGKILTE